MPRASSGGWLPRSLPVGRHGNVIEASRPSVSAPKLPGSGGSRRHAVMQDYTRRHMAVNIRTFTLEAHHLDGLVAWERGLAVRPRRGDQQGDDPCYTCG
jgi:hypothetical protein